MKKKHRTSRCRIYKTAWGTHCSIYQQMSVFVVFILLVVYEIGDFDYRGWKQKTLSGLSDRHGTKTIPPERHSKNKEKNLLKQRIYKEKYEEVDKKIFWDFKNHLRFYPKSVIRRKVESHGMLNHAALGWVFSRIRELENISRTRIARISRNASSAEPIGTTARYLRHTKIQENAIQKNKNL